MGGRHFVDHVRERTRELRLTQSAAAAAFWLFVSVFPAGLVIINLLGVVLPQQDVAGYLAELAGNFPGSFGTLLVSQLQKVAAPSPGTGLIDTILVFISLWTVSNAAHILLDTVRRAYAVDKGSFIADRALALVVGVGALVVIAATAIAVRTTAVSVSVRGVATLVELVLATIGLALLYRTGSRRHATVPASVTGAGIASLAIVLVLLTLRLYVDVAPNLQAIYGTITGIVASLLAAYLCAAAVILGAIISAVRDGADTGVAEVSDVT